MGTWFSRHPSCLQDLAFFSCLCHSYIVLIIDQDAESLFNDFNGGEISGESIEANFVSLWSGLSVQ